MRTTVSHLEAAGLALAGYTLWVLCDVCLKYAGQSRVPPLQVTALVGLASALLIAVASAARGGVRMLWPKQPLFQAMRAMLDLGNNVCVLIALRHLPLAMFYIVIFLCPLTAALLARFWLREALSWKQVLALVVGLAGVVIAADPFTAARAGDRVGYLACMVCVACFSANLVWSRRLVQRESTQSMAFVSGLAIAVVAGLCSAPQAHPVSLRMSGVVAAVALFGVTGNVCMFLALRHARTAAVSQFHYSQLPTGALIGFLLWGERPTLAMTAGAVLIVAAGVYTATSGTAASSEPPEAAAAFTG